MSGVSRHKACKLCRDRKVRCDGEQPACEKCRRLGETCIYTATSKPTKADLAQTIESLRDRIGKCCQSPLVIKANASDLKTLLNRTFKDRTRPFRPAMTS